MLSCREAPDQNLNIIFVMSDDHACKAISSYDERLIETPNLDRLAEEGTIFLNSFVTNSICAPSRAVMLTGKFSHMNGQRDNSTVFDGSQVTFPKLLQGKGYQTAILGKWHLESDPTGFDYWNILPGQGSYYNPDFLEMGEKRRYEGYVTNITTDLAIEWLTSKRDKTKPFCLLLHNKAPHRTWEPDTANLAEFSERVFPLPSNFYDDYSGRVAASGQKMSIRADDMDLVYDLKMTDSAGLVGSRFNFRMDHTSRMNEDQKRAWNRFYDPLITEFLEEDPQGGELDEWKYQRYMRDYLACIRSVDDNMGRLLDYLDEAGLEANTVVIYTSDQGFYLGEHGWFDKRFMYEESMRTPLLVRVPGKKGRVPGIKQLVQNIDLAPTILDMAGIDTPADMQGRSFMPLVEGTGNNVEWRDALYYHYYEFPNEHAVKRHYGIRTGRYKLIHFYYDIDEWELFDLETDPGEMHNLYDDPGYAGIRDSLHQRLEELRLQYGDTQSDIDLK